MILKRLINIRNVNSIAKRHIPLFLALGLMLLKPEGAFSYCYRSTAYPEVGIHTVVIDAGHGGKDPGCVGAEAKEKDIALGIALQLGRMIQSEYKDVKVIYTRSDDRFVELYERARIANRNKADLFICIHVNASPSKSASGVETYVMGLHKSTANLNVAKRENASILMEDNYEAHYEGFDPNSDESYIALTLMQNAYLTQSLNFATKIQDQFKSLGRFNRGVRQAGFLVLWRTSMPSVLVETGFISNPKEETYLMSKENQKKLAEGIFQAFAKYKEEVDGTIKNTQRIEQTANTKANGSLRQPSEQKVILKVQIASSVKPIPLKPEYFNGLDSVSEYTSNGIYKYTIGSTTDMQYASQLQAIAREKGFKDAFVVAFQGTQRIPLDQGLKKLNN